MTYQQSHSDQVENVGSVDRFNRIMVGTTLITVAVLFTSIPAAAVAGIVAVGIYAGLTGAIGWDPLYPVVKAFQQRVPARTSHTVATIVQQPHGEQPSTGGYKKAA